MTMFLAVVALIALIVFVVFAILYLVAPKHPRASTFWQVALWGLIVWAIVAIIDSLIALF